MMISRREIWWADLGDPTGSAPGYRRPVLIIQADAFNRSWIRTVIVVILTSNTALLDAPGNVLLAPRETGLSKDSVANVSQVVTLDRDDLIECVGKVGAKVMGRVEEGLRLVLGV